MNMGTKSGIGRGLQNLGQQLLNAGMDKRRLDFDQQKQDRQMGLEREKLEYEKSADRERSDFDRKKFDRQMAFRTRELAARFGWQRGKGESAKTTTAPSPEPTAVPESVTPPMNQWEQPVGPLRLPSFGPRADASLLE